MVLDKAGGTAHLCSVLMGRGITHSFPFPLSSLDTEKGRNPLIPLPISLQIGQKREEPGFFKPMGDGNFHLRTIPDVTLQHQHSVVALTIDNLKDPSGILY